MPPTIQNGTNQLEKRPVKPAEKKYVFRKRLRVLFYALCFRSELVCKVKYCNTLPDIPFDLKFISYPFESNR